MVTLVTARLFELVSKVHSTSSGRFINNRARIVRYMAEEIKNFLINLVMDQGVIKAR